MSILLLQQPTFAIILSSSIHHRFVVSDTSMTRGVRRLSSRTSTRSTLRRHGLLEPIYHICVFDLACLRSHISDAFCFCVFDIVQHDDLLWCSINEKTCPWSLSQHPQLSLTFAYQDSLWKLVCCLSSSASLAWSSSLTRNCPLAPHRLGDEVVHYTSC